jgi:hypothetical protein
MPRQQKHAARKQVKAPVRKAPTRKRVARRQRPAVSIVTTAGQIAAVALVETYGMFLTWRVWYPSDAFEMAEIAEDDDDTLLSSCSCSTSLCPHIEAVHKHRGTSPRKEKY